MSRVSGGAHPFLLLLSHHPPPAPPVFDLTRELNKRVVSLGHYDVKVRKQNRERHVKINACLTLCFVVCGHYVTQYRGRVYFLDST